MIEPLRLASSTVSKHLSIRRNARLIDSRKQIRWMYYRLAGNDAPGQVLAALEWVIASFATSPQHEEDGRRLEEILQIDPEIFCGRQSRKGDERHVHEERNIGIEQ